MSDKTDTKTSNSEETKLSTSTVLIKGALLVFLAMSGNFLAELLGCKTQKLLSENMLAKHIILLFSIYFAVGFSKNLNPLTNMRNSVAIWVIFLLFTKLSVTSTGIIFAALTGLYIAQNFIDYHNDKNHLSEKTLNLILTLKKVLTIGIFVILIGGFAMYSRQQFLDHRENFSLMKLVLGTVSCDHKNLQNLVVQ